MSDQCWDWLGATAERDGSSRSDLLDGLVMLAMDADLKRAEDLMAAKARVIRLKARINEGQVKGHTEHERALLASLGAAEYEVERLSRRGDG